MGRRELKQAMTLLMTLLVASCGAKVNSSSKYYSNMLVERQCATNPTVPSPVALKISESYNDFLKKYPTAFLAIPFRSSDYKNPFIININQLEKKLLKLKDQTADEQYLSENFSNIAKELAYLYQDSMRFEQQKCSFYYLSTKRKQDIRPYLEIQDFCSEKNSYSFCSSETIFKLTNTEALFIEERAVKMCKSFDASEINCQIQFDQKKQTRSVADLVKFYQKRFQVERFDKLFSLRDQHLKFQCQKIENDVIQMTLKVFSANWNTPSLKALTSYVGKSWSRKNFTLKIEVVTSKEKGNDVVEIFPTMGGISYVPDNNNRQVYLSTSLDFETQKRVLTHEFGHVLGFPDCYIEFYDGKNKDLVYYEMGEENTNIMCSLKEGVSVPNSYLDQLTQNSCVFN